MLGGDGRSKDKVNTQFVLAKMNFGTTFAPWSSWSMSSKSSSKSDGGTSRYLQQENVLTGFCEIPCRALASRSFAVVASPAKCAAIARHCE